MKDKPLPENYTFVRKNPLWRLLSLLIYYVLAVPLGWVIDKALYGVRVHNRKALREVKGGFFLYAHHTQSFHDTYAPILAAFPRRNYVVGSRGAVSNQLLGALVPLLGGVPLPGNLHQFRQFMDALGERYRQGACVTIYPEAHIWPYYTGVRPFPAASFGYPVQAGAPVFAMATTYRKRRVFKNCPPLIAVTIGGPFWPDKTLPEHQARQKLRDEVYDFLKETTGSAENVAWYEYKKAPSKDAAEETKNGV
ncbi:MAG: 1-acyl-sn-glycerol-3-phosphate acyltransferase [Oscillospiraceae bacterium]|nr:1-acyl-sn-glycerol-3-phosphate acyltransferase [Oscillospiraceae bacterium]